MENLHKDKIHWHISINDFSTEIKEVVTESLSNLALKDEFYTSSTKWCFSFEELTLKPSVEAYFESFFSPMIELLGIALFWDYEGNVIFSKIMPIYISKKNTRRMHGKLEKCIPKTVVGFLAVQLFVFECDGQIESLLDYLRNELADEAKQLKILLRQNRFKECADFLANQLQELLLPFQLIIHELFRENYPSSILNDARIIKEKKNTLFYNTVIHIKQWES